MPVRVEVLGSGTVRAWAPGRFTFVGDHTDYNFGQSLAAPLALGTAAVVSRSAADEFLSVDGPHGGSRYAAACMELLRSDLDLPPVRIEVSGDLPVGKGLSSSASLICSVLSGLVTLVGAEWTPDELAAAAQRVENDYLGIPTGTLDQEIVVKCPLNAAALVDFGRDVVTHLPFPALEGHRFVIVDPQLPRQLASDNFGERRTECAAALTALMGATDREAWLAFRELASPSFEGLAPVSTRRLRHVWSENRRVHSMASATSVADVAALVNEAHISMRNDFEVSTPAMEAARSQVLEMPGVKAARMVGAGFGGCLLALVEDGAEVARYRSFNVC